MQLIKLTRKGSQSRVAYLATGGLVVMENTKEDGVEVRIMTTGTNVVVRETFDQIVEHFNAQLEGWR